MTRGAFVLAVLLAVGGAAAGWALTRGTAGPPPGASPPPEYVMADAPALAENAPPPGVPGLGTARGSDGAAGKDPAAASRAYWDAPLAPLTAAQQAALDGLIARLADPNLQVREDALANLMRWGRYAEKGLAALLEVLRDERGRVRQSAAAVLGCVGPVAVPGLLRIVAGDDAGWSAGAIGALRAWPGTAAAAVPALAQALKRPERDVRFAAARALRGYGADARFAVPALVEALSGDPSRGVREEAAVTLGTLGLELPTVVPALVGIIANPDDDEDVRATAGMVLGRLGPDAEPAVGALGRMAEGEALGPRLAALDALTALGRTASAAVPALLHLLTSDDEQFRRSAVWALATIDPASPDAIAAFTRSLRDQDGRVAQGAAVGLLWAGLAGWDVLAAGLDDAAAEFGVRTAPYSPPPGRPVRERLDFCCALVDDRRPFLAEIGRRALSVLWGLDATCVPLVTGRLLAAKTPEERCFWIDMSMREGNDLAAAAPVLVRMLDDPDPRVWFSAARATSSGAVPRSVAVMEKVFAGLSEPARVFAALEAIRWLDAKTLEPAVPRIREIAKSGDGRAKAAAQAILDRLARPPGRVSPVAVPPPTPGVPPPPPAPTKIRDR